MMEIDILQRRIETVSQLSQLQQLLVQVADEGRGRAGRKKRKPKRSFFKRLTSIFRGKKE
jgi:hypothetical protein